MFFACSIHSSCREAVPRGLDTCAGLNSTKFATFHIKTRVSVIIYIRSTNSAVSSMSNLILVESSENTNNY